MAFAASRKDPGTGQVYTYTKNWDSYMIYGCTCDAGYSGYDCSEQDCPLGDDPLTLGSEEIQVFKCELTPPANQFALQYKGLTTPMIAATATRDVIDAALRTLFSMQDYQLTMYGSSSTVCGGDSVVQIKFMQEFGVPQHLIAVDASGNAIANSYILFSYDSTVQLSTLAQSPFTGVPGTKENIPCSGRGSCDTTTGYCTCYTGFATGDGNLVPGVRGDCSYPADPIASCPGDTIECSGHGVCNGYPTYTCTCDNGWASGDCSERLCPVGYDWFAQPTADDTAHFTRSECSNKGTCDRESGTCQCQEMFEGDACERMTCPGRTPCNGHGVCTTMSGLAEYHETNGESDPKSYGLIPNKKETWDFKMVYGCACDENWMGYDCSKRVCPYGDDSTQYYTSSSANTNNKVLKQLEVQSIRCEPTVSPAPVLGTYGFTLTFRDATTPLILSNTKISAIQGILEALPTIDNVEVSSSTNDLTDNVCGAGAWIHITFHSPSGDVPQLHLTFDNPAHFDVAGTQVFNYYTGTGDYVECSGRGLCDRYTGTCQCFIGYGSSDGGGLKGPLNDCGYRLPYDPVLEFSDIQKLRGEFRPSTVRRHGWDEELDTIDRERQRETERGLGRRHYRPRGDLGFERDWDQERRDGEVERRVRW